MKRFRKVRRHIIIAVLLLFAVFQTPILLVNNPRFQQWFLETYKPFQPWSITVGSLRLKPWLFELNIHDLRLQHPSGHHLSFDTIHIALNPFRLLRGQVGISNLIVQSPTLALAKSVLSKKEAPKKKFKIRTLILLQNLVVSKGTLEDITLRFPDETDLKITHLGLKLKPSIRRGTQLDLQLQNALYTNPDQTTKEIENLNVEVATNFSRWSKTFPYIDDIDGLLTLRNARLDKLHIHRFETHLRLDKSKIRSKKFVIQIDENEILGKLDADLSSEKFSFHMETPKGVVIPELGDETRTFNVAGLLTAKIDLEGEGFDIPTSKGKGNISAQHIFEHFEEHPAKVDTRFEWQHGKLTLYETNITTDEAVLQAKGTIDLKPFSFHLQMQTDHFPLERLFEKFEDKNLHPIHGKAHAEGKLEGAGKTIHLSLIGEATEGGYGPVLAQKAKVTLDLTHPQLKLDGKIITDEKETGKALFLIQYGEKKASDKTRPKKITLDTQFENHPIATSLPDLPLDGNLTAQLKLKGAPENIQGECHFVATDGNFLKEGFENITGHFTLNAKSLKIDKADFLFSNGDESHFIRPLVLDFKPEGLRLSGQPLEGLNIDVNYFSKNTSWQISKLTIADQTNPSLKTQISGRIAPEGLDLKGNGDLDLAKLKFLSRILRDASGPAYFQLAVRGKMPNIQMNGKVDFKGNRIYLRAYPYAAENLEGTILFEGNRIRATKLTGEIESGAFELNGMMLHAGGKPSSVDLNLSGHQISYRDKAGDLRMEFDADLSLKGPAEAPELAGTITVVDGRYTKDFNIIEELKRAPSASREIKKAALEEQPWKLNLKVKNLGDLVIDNNVGKIDLIADLKVKGTLQQPILSGTVNTTEGEIHYLGLDFDITRGFIEFREYAKAPYLEVDAEQELEDAHIVAKLHGPTNNLAIDLSGNSIREGPLDKKEVLSLILFGTTGKTEQPNYFEQRAGTGLAAEQVAAAFQRPFARATHLDVFRLESVADQHGEDQASKLTAGKRLNDRLTVEFASELKQDDAVQSFQLEYWLTDFFILKGAQSTDESYQMGGGFKIRSR